VLPTVVVTQHARGDDERGIGTVGPGTGTKGAGGTKRGNGCIGTIARGTAGATGTTVVWAKATQFRNSAREAAAAAIVCLCMVAAFRAIRESVAAG
jgi:hypothetical protein